MPNQNPTPNQEQQQGNKRPMNPQNPRQPGQSSDRDQDASQGGQPGWRNNPVQAEPERPDRGIDGPEQQNRPSKEPTSQPDRTRNNPPVTR